MSKGYFIGQIDITDPQAYGQYRDKVPAIVQAHGGRYLVRGGALELAEGDAPLPRTVVLEFPSVAAAKAWYESPEYQAILPIRLGASNGTAFFVEGA